jgi:hypothetical protein
VHLQEYQAAWRDTEPDVLPQNGLGAVGGPGVDPVGLTVAAEVVTAETGPPLTRRGVVLGPGEGSVLGFDEVDESVVDDRRVLRLELCSGQESRLGQLGIDQDATVFVGAAAGR